MQPRHRVSRTAIDLIKRFEGYRRKAAELPDGRWTIGHGHTLTARQGAEVSEEDAEALLLYDLIGIAHAINESVFIALSQNQFDALACFAFSIGLDNFHRSGVLRRINEGASVQAACAMGQWRRAEIGGERIVVDALVRRRAVETSLFLTPDDGVWIAAPSPILKPLLDSEAFGVVPGETPAAVTELMDGETIVVRREGESSAPSGERVEEEHGPATAAAEVVTARLQTIFQEPGEEPAEAAQADEPIHIPEDPHPQADFGPPIHLAAEPAQEPDEPFALHPPSDIGTEEEDEEDVLIGDFEIADEGGQPHPDLFDLPTMETELDDPPPAANDPVLDEIDADLAFLARLPEASAEGPRETVDFIPPAAQPLPREPKGGLLTLIALALLGLAFAAGGVFWATNARPMSPTAWLDPRVVGWLAGITGIAFFATAIFLLLERLGEASEQTARHRR
jgi:lysozyme